MYDPNSGYHGADPSILQKEGANLAHQAVMYDQQERYDLALFYYTVSHLTSAFLPCKPYKMLAEHLCVDIFTCPA